MARRPWLTWRSRRRRPRRGARSTRAAADALDAWHAACARGDGDALEALAADAFVFFGTAAEERWARDAFLQYARQRFATGNTWSYAVVARRCDEVSDGVVAFDEVLDNVNLGRSRSTGVIIGGKLAQYNLSLPVPNEMILGVVEKIRGRRAAPVAASSSSSTSLGTSCPCRAATPTRRRRRRRKRAGEYWGGAGASGDEASMVLAGRLLSNVVAVDPRREDKFRAHVQRARGRVNDVDDAAVGALWRELDDAAKALAAPDAGRRGAERAGSRVLPWATATCGPCIAWTSRRAASWSSRAPPPPHRACAAFRKSTDGAVDKTRKTCAARGPG